MEKGYIIVSPDKKWNAEISAFHGGNVIRLQYCQKDVLVPLKSKEQLEQNPFIIGCPLLFPANRTYKGEFEFEGKKYSLPINEPATNSHLHGSLYAQQFETEEITPGKIVLAFKNTGEIYPFYFRILIEYMVDNNGFYQKIVIKNTGNTNMPYTFGLHTTFVEPAVFSAPIELCQERDKHFLPTGRYISLDFKEQQYVKGVNSKDNVVSGCYKSSGNTVCIDKFEYSVSSNFDHWMLYNGGGESGFLCAEPQCGAVNGLNLPYGHKILKPNAQETFYTKITVR